MNSFLLFLSLNILPTASYLLVNTIIVWVQLLAFQTRFMRPMITHMMITLLYCPTETQVVVPLSPNILGNYRHRNVSPNLKSLTSHKLSSPWRLGRLKTTKCQIIIVPLLFMVIYAFERYKRNHDLFKFPVSLTICQCFEHDTISIDGCTIPTSVRNCQIDKEL